MLAHVSITTCQPKQHDSMTANLPMSMTKCKHLQRAQGHGSLTAYQHASMMTRQQYIEYICPDNVSMAGWQHICKMVAQLAPEPAPKLWNTLRNPFRNPGKRTCSRTCCGVFTIKLNNLKLCPWVQTQRHVVKCEFHGLWHDGGGLKL